jgi:hypothetical protein
MAKCLPQKGRSRLKRDLPDALSDYFGVDTQANG